MEFLIWAISDPVAIDRTNALLFAALPNSIKQNVVDALYTVTCNGQRVITSYIEGSDITMIVLASAWILVCVALIVAWLIMYCMQIKHVKRSQVPSKCFSYVKTHSISSDDSHARWCNFCLYFRHFLCSSSTASILLH